MKTNRIPMLLLLLSGLTASVFAQTNPPASPPPKPPSLPPESHQFDFWLGAWDVTTPDGKPAGTSLIQSIANGAGLLENWEGAGGSPGKSLNTYNQAKKQWQQFWVGGGVLELAGGLVDGSMVLTGEHDAGGKHLIEKITWTPNPDGSVRQHWEQSTDGGKTWTDAFDGLYRRRK